MHRNRTPALSDDGTVGTHLKKLHSAHWRRGGGLDVREKARSGDWKLLDAVDGRCEGGPRNL